MCDIYWDDHVKCNKVYQNLFVLIKSCVLKPSSDDFNLRRPFCVDFHLRDHEITVSCRRRFSNGLKLKDMLYRTSFLINTYNRLTPYYTFKGLLFSPKYEAAAPPIPVDQMWSATKQVYKWIVDNYDGAYQQGMALVPDEYIQTAWSFCANDDNVATADDITDCSIRMADWADMSDYTRDYMYKFGQKYW